MDLESPPHRECIHSPFDGANTLVVESHWAAGVRVRCDVCGACASVGKHGAVTPERCECHSAGDGNGVG